MTITRTSLLLGIIFAGVAISFPFFAHAVAGASTMANPTCVQCVAEATAKKVPPAPYCLQRICVDTTNGVTKGHCVMTECHADSFSGAGQSGGTGLDQVMKALGDLFGKLMQPKPPSSPPPSTPPPSTNPTGCQGSYFQTSDISQISNPFAQYTPPPVSTDITPDTGSCSVLNETLGLCTNTPSNCPNVPNVDCSPGNHPVSGGKDADGCVLQDTCAPDSTETTTTSPTMNTGTRFTIASTTGTFVVPPGGTRGDINVRADGATVIGGARDTQSNVEIAGFYGSETFGGQGSQGLVGTWCKDRPWATNFLSQIIPPTFFDNVCTSIGYQVGTPPAAPAVVLQQTPKPKSKPVSTATTTSATTTPGVPPKVDIWAVPAAVPLGGRTSVFWNTQGVTECTETSPNGGFSQNSLSGGAATQPITAATTFSISCLAPDGTPVTGFVTVNLKI